LNIPIKNFVHKSNMSGEANSTFSTITPKKNILGKLLTHKMFTAEKNKESAFVLSIFLSRNRLI
jgi:hypothetical protein